MLKCQKMFLFISLPIYSIATSIICYFLSSSLLLFVQGQRRSCKYWTWGGGGGGGQVQMGTFLCCKYKLDIKESNASLSF